MFKADLTVDGSFDEAVNGVDGVFHTASPVIVPQDHNIQETLVDPIIKGTTNVMNSCAKSKTTLKRIVLTSSCSSIRYRFDATKASPLNESHWSDIEYCKRFNVRKTFVIFFFVTEAKHLLYLYIERKNSIDGTCMFVY